MAQPDHRSNADDMSKALPPEHPYERHLVRTLGLVDVVMIGIAGMIGGSIFVLVGPAIGLAGSAVIFAFMINGIITLFTAMGYAELGSAMPEAGVAIYGLEKDYHDLILLLVAGWHGLHILSLVVCML